MNQVKSYLFFTLMIFATTLQAQFGVKGGLNLSNSQSYGNSEDGELEEFKPGFQGGIFYKAGISDMFSLMVELNYEARGVISKKKYGFELLQIVPVLGPTEYQIQEESSSRHTYINLPIIVLLGNGNLKGYIGANIGYLISAKGDFNGTVDALVSGSSFIQKTQLEVDWQDYDSFKSIFLTDFSEDGGFLNSLDYGINLGAMYYVGAGFVVDLRVSQGFADTTNNHYDNSLYTSDGFTFESREDMDRNFSVQFGVGYFF